MAAGQQTGKNLQFVARDEQIQCLLHPAEQMASPAPAAAMSFKQTAKVSFKLFCDVLWRKHHHHRHRHRRHHHHHDDTTTRHNTTQLKTTQQQQHYNNDNNHHDDHDEKIKIKITGKDGADMNIMGTSVGSVIQGTAPEV